MSEARPGSHHLVDHLFRHEAGHLTAMLTRLLGVQNLAIAEEITQDTLLKALQVWPYHPPIEQPAAWLRRVARNLAIDHIRRNRLHELRIHSAGFIPPSVHPPTDGWLGSTDTDPLNDELLRMMFLCCQPNRPIADQVALCLNVVGGLSSQEIAAAFLVTPEAMRKRIYRAKKDLRARRTAFELPSEADLPMRLDSVLAVIYLMFNEGYHSAGSDQVVRRDLCAEAVRLAGLLLQHQRLRPSRVYALAALLSFQAARLPGRLDDQGDILLLEDQDRSAWDKRLIRQGFALLGKAKKQPCKTVSAYHLEAGIAGVHCAAASMETTDWPQILAFYDLLAAQTDSPMIRLNRSIALGYAHGPCHALPILDSLTKDPTIAGHYLLWAALAEFSYRNGNGRRAIEFIQRASEKAPGSAQRRLLAKKSHIYLKNPDLASTHTETLRLNNGSKK